MKFIAVSLAYCIVFVTFASCNEKPKSDAITAAQTKLKVRNSLTDSLKEVEELMCNIGYEHFPEFPGGLDALKRFLTKNTHWPKTTVDTTGVVYVSFLVQEDGNVTDVQVLKGLHADFDAEAARPVQKMPRWKPGKLNGKKEATRLTLPIRFAKRLHKKK